MIILTKIFFTEKKYYFEYGWVLPWVEHFEASVE